MAELKEKVKTDLRISHSKLDDDIVDNINACLRDMKRIGIDINEMDLLLEKAVKLYMRWQYNFENQGERYGKAYSDLTSALSLCSDYKMDL